MIRIIADDKIPFLKGVLEPYAEVQYVPGEEITAKQLETVDGLIVRTRTRCNKALLDHSAIKFIATATIGHDHIDSSYCNEKGITWTNAPGCNSGSVQQYIASTLMHIEVKEQKPISEFTLGIVGVGNVGRKVEKLARALGMKVILNDPPRARSENPSGFSSLNDLLNQSDIVSLHVPLNPVGEDKTFHMADESFFRKMKPQSWLINASRGEVCSTRQLKIAHQSGILKDLILDVWENEPNIDLELLKSCFIATPHIAGYSADGKANGTSMSVQACSKFFGFGLNNWYPLNLPLPDNTYIDLSTEKLSRNELIRKTILTSYAVCEDDSALRSSPGSFEKLRGNYPLRREFPAYRVKLSPDNPELASVLADIGFTVEASSLN